MISKVKLNSDLVNDFLEEKLILLPYIKTVSEEK